MSAFSVGRNAGRIGVTRIEQPIAKRIASEVIDKYSVGRRIGNPNRVVVND